MELRCKKRQRLLQEVKMVSEMRIPNVSATGYPARSVMRSTVRIFIVTALYAPLTRTMLSRVDNMWRRMVQSGDLYIGTHEGWYCSSDEIFVPENMVELALPV